MMFRRAKSTHTHSTSQNDFWLLENDHKLSQLPKETKRKIHLKQLLTFHWAFNVVQLLIQIAEGQSKIEGKSFT